MREGSAGSEKKATTLYDKSAKNIRLKIISYSYFYSCSLQTQVDNIYETKFDDKSANKELMIHIFKYMNMI